MTTTPELLQDLERQLALLRNRAESAVYEDGSCARVHHFRVSSESAMQLENASGFAFQVLDALPVSVFVKDAERRYVYLNAKARVMMNFSSKCVIGKRDREVLSDRENYRHYALEDEAVMLSKAPRQVKEEWRDETGRFTVHLTTRYPIMRYDDPAGAPLGVVSIAENLTYEQKLDAANELMTLITHDLVTGILRTIDFHGTTDGKLQEYLPAYDFLLDYLDALAWYLPTENGVKAFARSIDMVDFSAAVIEPINKILPALLRPKVIDSPVEWRCGDNLPFQVTCNPRMLRIMVYQQVRNHLRHGDQWSISEKRENKNSRTRTPLRIEISPISTIRGVPTKGYALTFCSQGEPIPPEFREQLGIRGFRVPKRDRYGFIKASTGIGFGLYFCRRIADLHSGEFIGASPICVGCPLSVRLQPGRG